MAKWFKLILFSVFMCSSLLSYAEDSSESDVSFDWYDEYERINGNVKSIADEVGNNDRYLAGASYSPHFTIKTEDFVLQVVEMWSDGNEMFANVELSINSGYGIVRPYEWSLTNSRYYTPIDLYKVPLYFFFAEIGLAPDKVATACSFGINSLNQTMNRIQYCSINDGLEPEDDTKLIYFRVYIERHENGLISHDTVCFALPCPHVL